MVSEQAPERPASSASSASRARGGPGQGTGPGGKKPPGKENVFTRKIGPLPMWVWLAIAAVLILGYVLFFGSKKGSQGSQGKNAGHAGRYGRRGFGWFLRPPHTRNHHGRGRHHHHAERQHAAGQAQLRKQMPAAGTDGTGTPAGVSRVARRGHPVPGSLVRFKAADKGATPSLADVANRYDTTPDAIVEEAHGRGAPGTPQWSRYVAQQDWGKPLPPATELSILAHPR